MKTIGKIILAVSSITIMSSLVFCSEVKITKKSDLIHGIEREKIEAAAYQSVALGVEIYQGLKNDEFKIRACKILKDDPEDWGCVVYVMGTKTSYIYNASIEIDKETKEAFIKNEAELIYSSVKNTGELSWVD